MKNRRGMRWLAWAMALMLSLSSWALAQEAPESARFRQEELERMLAPVALYPDALLGQVLTASTYPLEIVMAERWSKANPNLKGKALTAALEEQSWDPSVKSLVNFPQVLSLMSEKLEWTQMLGDAFLAQRKEVMDTVQQLRGRAREAGNLDSTGQQKVVVQEKTIVIESPSPQVIYVPAYDPVVVYGAWPYPAYPPYPVYPAGYGAAAFGVGVAVGVAWGYAWSHCDWDGGDVDIDINRNININDNIDRGKYAHRTGEGGSGTWRHDPEHRKGVAYRDQETARRYDRGSSPDAGARRDSFRGRADSGRQDAARPGADRAGGPGRERGSAGLGGRDSAFGGIDRGAQAGRESLRGRLSREGMGARGGGRGGGFRR